MEYERAIFRMHSVLVGKFKDEDVTMEHHFEVGMPFFCDDFGDWKACFINTNCLIFIMVICSICSSHSYESLSQ